MTTTDTAIDQKAGKVNVKGTHMNVSTRQEETPPLREAEIERGTDLEHRLRLYIRRIKRSARH